MFTHSDTHYVYTQWYTLCLHTVMHTMLTHNDTHYVRSDTHYSDTWWLKCFSPTLQTSAASKIEQEYF
jgi:hypothetical protein